MDSNNISHNEGIMHHRSHDNNREIARQVHKILDECATKLKDDPRRYTSMFIKEKLNNIMLYLLNPDSSGTIVSSPEIIQMIHSFWKRQKNNVIICDVCVDVLLVIIKERKVKIKNHFGNDLGLKKFKPAGPNTNGPEYTFNEYLDQRSFIYNCIRLRLKQVKKMFNDENYRECEKILIIVEQKSDIISKAFKDLIPDDDHDSDDLEKLYHFKHVVIPKMRIQLDKKLKTSGNNDNHSSRKRNISNNHNNGSSILKESVNFKKQRIEKPKKKKKKKKKKRKKKNMMMMMPMSSEDEESDEEEEEEEDDDDEELTPIADNNGSKTPIADDDDGSGSGGRTPVIVESDVTPIAEDGGRTPIIVENDATPIADNDDGEHTPILFNTTIESNFNNEIADEEEQKEVDVMNLLSFAGQRKECINKYAELNYLSQPESLSDEMIDKLTRRDTKDFFVTRRMKLTLPKNWLDEVNPPRTLVKTEGMNINNTDSDLWMNDFERYWNNGDFILKRIKTGTSPNKSSFLARKVNANTWESEPEKKFDLFLGSVTNNELRNANKNKAITITNAIYKDDEGVMKEDEDKIQIELDMYDITKLGDCTFGDENLMCDDCEDKLKNSNAFIFNYGAPLKFVLVCRKPKASYTEGTNNHNHADSIHYEHFPMIEFEINYGLMDLKRDYNDKKCMQIRKAKYGKKSWGTAAQLQYDAVKFQFDAYQRANVAVGNVSDKSITQAGLELECDIIAKAHLLRKLERDRKDARAKTGLLEHNISQQRKCDNKRCSNGYQTYKLFNSSGWGNNSNNGKWVCRRCSCECGESLVELKVEDRYRCEQDRVSKGLAADGDIWICWNRNCDIVYDRRFLSYRGRCQRTGCKGILDPDGKCDFCTCRYCRKPLDRDSENPTLWKCNNNCTYKVETDIEKGFVKGVVRYITESR